VEERTGREEASWPGAGAAEHLEVVVRVAGRLPIPRLVVHLLDLVPGDLILQEEEPDGLSLLPFRELMRRPDLVARHLEWVVGMPPERFALVAPDVTLYAPHSAFPLVPGEVLVWQVEDRGGGFDLSVRKKIAR
jgi:hypothetical protein